MKSSGRIEGSICGAIFSFPAARSRQALKQQHGQRRQHSIFRGRSQQKDRPGNRICQSGSQKEVPSFVTLARSLFASAFPERIPQQKRTIRFNYSTASPAASAAPAIPSIDRSIPVKPQHRQTQVNQLSKEELLAFVDEADDDLSLDEHFNFLRDKYQSGYAHPESDEVMVSDRLHDIEYPLPSEAHRGDDSVQSLVYDLRRAVLLRLRNPDLHSAEEVYHLYRQLPPNPISYLSARLRHQFLQSLAVSDKKDAASMLRYFAVVADVKSSGLTLNRAEWNSAMSFASRYVGTVTETELEATLDLWREMEQDANIKGNHVTFNILFDVASKAGNFTLAEMIYQEMEKRGHAFNRYHHVSLIHFFGLKQDPNGVRAAYRAMVEAGELIDAVVLNCVIAGFLRSGEERAAHMVYRRMRAQHAKATRLPRRTYNTNKMVTKVLMMFARVGRQHPDLRTAFQASSPMTPDIATYRMLIAHHAINLGDLSMVAQYLDEMKFLGVPLHGSIFLALFKGFANYGGIPMLAWTAHKVGISGTTWSAQRLRSVFDAFLRVMDGGAAGLYIDTWLGISVLKAFDRCCTPEEVFKAYNIMSLRWDLDEQQTDHMITVLHSLLRDKMHQVEVLKSLANKKYG